jgi:hypothetical protein
MGKGDYIFHQLAAGLFSFLSLLLRDVLVYIVYEHEGKGDF